MFYKTRSMLPILAVCALSFLLTCALSLGIVAQSSENERISTLNKVIQEKGYHWKAGKTSMSYLSDESFKRLVPPLPKIPDDVLRTMPVFRASAAAMFDTRFDWRDSLVITPIKDQAACGSCWAHAAVGQLESHMQIADGIIEGLDLSEMQLVGCKVGGFGCAGALFLDAYRLFQFPGSVDESCLPYNPSGLSTPCLQEVCAVHARTSSYYLVNNDVNSIKGALLSGPLWISMFVPQAFRDYTGGVFDTDVREAINHAMLLVGWDDSMGDDGAWIIKNSWGTGWGDSGYAYVAYGVCNVGEYTTQITYMPSSTTDFIVESPNGGEEWVVGLQYPIKWHCNYSDVDHFEVGYDDGANYHVIDDAVAAGERVLSWTVPNNLSGSCKVTVKAYDEYDNVAIQDASDDFFSIIETSRGLWGLSGSSVSAESHSQESCQIISNGSDGAIIAWEDSRSDDGDIYVQKMNASGSAAWTTNGVALCTASGSQSVPRLVTDKFGGAITVWTDARNGATDIYAQRVNASGSVLWTADGVAICTAANAQSDPKILPDGSGGAIIVWQDGRSDDGDIYAQRVNASGSVLWTGGGVAICTASNAQHGLQIASDGSTGAIVTWQDNRSDDGDIYAQRVDATGSALWTSNGIAVCTASDIQSLPRIAPDASGGAIIAWVDNREPIRNFNSLVYCQRVNAGGVAQWAANGVEVCENNLLAAPIQIAANNRGGAFVVWTDMRNEGESDIYAQWVDLNGTMRWTSGGVSVCRAVQQQSEPEVACDDDGGAVIAWLDCRNQYWHAAHNRFYDGFDIYGQRLNSLGNPLWREDGEPLCILNHTGPNYGRRPMVTKDHNQHIFAAWEDARNGLSNLDIYAQRLSGYFSFPPPCTIDYEFFNVATGQKVNRFFMNGCPKGDFEFLRATLEFDVANLTRDILYTEITLVKPDSLITFWSNGSIHADSNVSLDNAVNGKVKTTITHAHFSRDWALNDYTLFGRDVDILMDDEYLGSLDALTLKSPDYTGDGAVNSSDMYYFNLTYKKSQGQPGYNTWFDFTGDNKVNSADYALMAAHMSDGKPPGYDPYQEPVSPRPALASVRVTARESGEPGGIELTLYLENAAEITTACLGLKNDPGKYEYVGYRANEQAGAEMLVAPVSRNGLNVLIVSAFGFKPNPTGEAELGTIELALKGERDLSALGEDFAVLCGDVRYADGTVKYLRVEGYEIEQPTPRPVNSLANAFPNPFNPATTIKYSIANDTPVNLSVYNVNGQLVRTLVNETQKSNAYAVVWNGKDNQGGAVQSGVYFYRIKTNSFAQSKKFVLLR